VVAHYIRIRGQTASVRFARCVEPNYVQHPLKICNPRIIALCTYGLLISLRTICQKYSTVQYVLIIPTQHTHPKSRSLTLSIIQINRRFPCSMLAGKENEDLAAAFCANDCFRRLFGGLTLVFAQLSSNEAIAKSARTVATHSIFRGNQKREYNTSQRGGELLGSVSACSQPGIAFCCVLKTKMLRVHNVKCASPAHPNSWRRLCGISASICCAGGILSLE